MASVKLGENNNESPDPVTKSTELAPVLTLNSDTAPAGVVLSERSLRRLLDVADTLSIV
jgi:hypothetical protein